MDDKRTGSWKKRREKGRKLQESKRTSQEENADAVSEQSTESSVFEETSLVEPLLMEEEKRDQFVGRNSERRAKERTKKKKGLYAKLEVGQNKRELHAHSNCMRIITTKVHYLHPASRVTKLWKTPLFYSKVPF